MLRFLWLISFNGTVGIMLKKLFIQAIKFVGISGIGWLIDFGVFTILGLFGIPSQICNIISSLCGVTFVFFVSTRKTFEVSLKRLNLKQKYIIYVLFEVIIILVASKFVGILDGFFKTVDFELLRKFSAIAAKICVTPFTMLINFVFMKILTENV